MPRSAVSPLLVLVAVSLTACKGPGSKVDIPKTPGTFSLVVEQGDKWPWTKDFLQWPGVVQYNRQPFSNRLLDGLDLLDTDGEFVPRRPHHRAGLVGCV